VIATSCIQCKAYSRLPAQHAPLNRAPCVFADFSAAFTGFHFSKLAN